MQKNVDCEMLQWDTDFFGHKTAQVRGHRLDEQKLTRIANWCQKNEIDCLYFLADSDDRKSLRLAEGWGFRLVDIRITFEYDISDRHSLEHNISNHGYQIRTHRQSDISSLERIARDIYHDTRFYYDPCFSEDACRRLYATWIKRSCEDYADQVLVAENKGNPIGYISCHLNHESSVGRVGLLGVDQQDRSRSVGKMLLLDSLKWFAEQGMEKVRVVTQGKNIGAQRFYERYGFYTYLVQIWFHKWFSECESEKGQ